MYRTVVVNLTADPDTAFSGVLWTTRGGWLVLRKVSIIKPNLEPMPVDGEVVLHRSTVSFIQVLP